MAGPEHEKCAPEKLVSPLREPCGPADGASTHNVQAGQAQGLENPQLVQPPLAPQNLQAGQVEGLASHGEFMDQDGGGECRDVPKGEPPKANMDGAFMTADGAAMSVKGDTTHGPHEQALENYALSRKAAKMRLTALEKQLLVAHQQAYRRPIEWENRLGKQQGEPLSFVSKKYEQERLELERFFVMRRLELKSLLEEHAGQQEGLEHYETQDGNERIEAIEQQVRELAELQIMPPQSLPVAGYGLESPRVETGVDKEGRLIEFCHPFWEGEGVPMSLPPLYLDDEEGSEPAMSTDFQVSSEKTQERTAIAEGRLQRSAEAGDKSAGKTAEKLQEARGWEWAPPKNATDSSATDNPFDLAVRVTGKEHGLADWEARGWEAFREGYGVIDFCGQMVPGHTLLLERLEVAQRALEAHTGKSGQELGAMLEVSGASGSIRLGKSSSYHSLGLAIDINASTNPWIAGHQYGDRGPEDVELVAKANAAAVQAIWHAVWLVGKGEPYSPTEAADWKGTTAELHGRVLSGSEALQEYFALREDPVALQNHVNALKVAPALPELRPAERNNEANDEVESVIAQTRKEMLDDLVLLSPAGGDSQQMLRAWERALDKDYEANFETPTGGSNWDVHRNDEGDASRETEGTGYLDLARNLVVALRDVGGLAWGAVDFGEAQNGDMMHFDCRQIETAALLKTLLSNPEKAKAILNG